MKNHHKGFFNYTRKERTGIIVLVCLIIATIVIPSFLPVPVMEVDQAAFEKLRTQLSVLEQRQPPAGAADMVASGYEGDDHDPVETPKASLFAFDPNTLNVSGWVQLGIRMRTAETIRKYVLHGGRFRKPEDLYKIYGLRKEEADRLLPYVEIPESDRNPKRNAPGQDDDRWEDRSDERTGGKIDGGANTATDRDREGGKAGGNGKGQWGRGGMPVVLDINTADTSDFIALRGIGSRLAGRIVNFREKLGGFHSVDQVGETYGLPDSTFQSIRPLLRCSNPSLRMIDINSADAVLLDQHPYISRSQAWAMVRYREQHGAYQTVDQLLQIAIMTPEMVEKMKPYLTVQ